MKKDTDSQYVKEAKERERRRPNSPPNQDSLLGCFLLLLIPIFGFVWFNTPSAPRTSSEPNSSSKVANDTGYIIVAREHVASKLKDPDSARFDGLYVSRKIGTPVVCGTVNAKNSFGGYSGKVRFISGGDGIATQIENSGEMSLSEFEKAWVGAC